MPNQLALLEQAQSTLIDLAIKFGPKVVVARNVAVRCSRPHGSLW